jgi:hypothetical protein
MLFPECPGIYDLDDFRVESYIKVASMFGDAGRFILVSPVFFKIAIGNFEGENNE